MPSPAIHTNLSSLFDASTPRPRQAEDFPVRMPRREASDYLKEVHGLNRHEPATLTKMATEGRGPPFYKNGRWVLYARDDLDRYAAERLGTVHHSTAEYPSIGGRPRNG
jgi:hypothetical protein